MLKFLKPTLLTALSVALAACSQGEAEKSEVIEKVKLSADAPVVSPDADGGWKLAWSDEFDGDEIDRSKWGFDINCWGGGNNERQCYTDAKENASLRDGKLVITAIKEEASGYALSEHMRADAEDPDAQQSKPFTSARMVTKGKAAWRYGWIEIRAKLPQGQGTWPAIWMLPEDNEYGTWAASGEIDILEAVNMGVPCAECPGGKENTILGTLHFGDLWPNNSLNSTEISQPGSLDEFHTYSVVWSEGKFTWLVDGKVFATKTAEDWFSSGSDAPNAPFDEKFHLILNLAIGGQLPEERGLKGVSEDGFPKQFEVDWVRVWQCEADPATGNGCELKRGD